jgi:hypothetical protein
MKIMNKHRFWAGAGIFIGEFLALIIFCMTLIHWDWLTTKVLLICLGALVILLLNILATMCMWSGSKEKPKLKKK